MLPVSKVQKLLLGVFLLLPLLPGARMVQRHVETGRWNAEPQLFGASLSVEPVAWTTASWFSGQFQERFANWFGVRFGHRRNLVMTYNQFLFSVFRVSHMSGGSVRVGPNGWLYEKGYLDEYFDVPRAPKTDSWRGHAEALVKLDEVCRERGKILVVMVSPSKAAAVPGEAPRWFQKHGIRPDRIYPQWISFLLDRNIPVIDGPEILHRLAVNPDVPDTFPKGGTHWNDHAAAFVVRELVHLVEPRLGQPPPFLEIGPHHIDDHPTGSDADLANTLNLPGESLRYPVLRFDRTITQSETCRGPRVFWVGSSFSWNALAMAKTDSARLFSELTFGYYHKRFLAWNESGTLVGLPGRFSALPLLDSVDLVVVEVNESAIGDVDYVPRFANDAFLWLQSAPKLARQGPQP
jgi:hypothetical protein